MKVIEQNRRPREKENKELKIGRVATNESEK